MYVNTTWNGPADGHPPQLHIGQVLLATFLKYVIKNESGLILPKNFVEPITNQPLAGVAHIERGKFAGLRPVKSNERKGYCAKNYIIV